MDAGSDEQTVRVPLLARRDGEERQDWIPRALTRRLTLQGLCKVVNTAVLVLAIVSILYSVYLLLGPEVTSACKKSAAPSEAELFAVLVPFLIMLPSFANFWCVREEFLSWSTLLLLQGNCGIILSGWMAICAWGGRINLVLNVCGILLASQVAVWTLTKFKVLEVVKRGIEARIAAQQDIE